MDAGRVPGATLVRWEVYSHGGRTPEGLDALAWCRRVAELGAGEILLTSVCRKADTGAGGNAVLAASILHLGQHTTGEAEAFRTARGLEIRR